MQHHFINHLFNTQTTQVLFWTLTHSLWQGLVFALIAAIVLASTKKSATALRYKLLSGCLALFIITSALTFCYEAFSVAKHVASSADPVITSPGGALVIAAPDSIIQKLILLVLPYENRIVLAWVAVIAFKFLGLVKGLRDVHVLKHRHVLDAGDYWNSRVKALAESAGIKRSVVLLQSAIAKMPMVAGYFKPVILFPAAALTALAPEEVEAILLHELAHIHRKDYLINLFQRIAEIIFFFNPAVTWMSSLIKDERENCCDDIAVRQTNNKRQLVQALVSFQEYSATAWAPSFSGQKNTSLNRIKRIITNNNKTLSSMEKTFLMAGIAITVFAAFAFSKHQHVPPHKPPLAATTQAAVTADKIAMIPQSFNDSDSTTVIKTTLDGKQYKLVEKNGKVTELYVDNVRIPDDKISGYSDVIAKLNEKMEARKKELEEQKEALAAQREAMAAQRKEMEADKLAMDSQAQHFKNMEGQAEELKEQMARLKMENDSDAPARLEALKAQEDMLHQKALAMQDDAENKAQFKQLKALKDEQKMQKDILKREMDESLVVSRKERETMLSQQNAMRAEMDQQRALMRDQQKKMMKMKDKSNEELRKQVESLRAENERLRHQLNQNHNTDSLQVSPGAPHQ